MVGRLRLVAVPACLTLALGACGGDTTEPITSTPETTAAETTAPSSPTTSTTEATTTTTEPAPDTTRGSAVFSVPFRFEVPEDSTLRPAGQTADQVLFVRGRNESLLFLIRDLDAWQTRLADKGATLSEPVVVTVGGVEGTALDVVAGDQFFTLTDTFAAEVGDSLRIVVVDVDGTAVSIVAVTGTDTFETWVDDVEGFLDTIEWGVGP